ncbi:MAG: helix-hairpin-helix domain-containing protein [Paludibacteraceae bacterium]|nr:helix-hairpin-helix domain-containing protein [Paludibacteraceae bacterium]
MKKPHISEQLVGYVWLLILITGVLLGMFIINQTDSAKQYRDEKRAYIQFKEDSIREAKVQKELNKERYAQQKEQWDREKEERAIRKAEREAEWEKQQAEWAAQYAERNQKKAAREAQRRAFDTVTVTLRPFDPNLADSDALVHLGIPPQVTHNIVRYRAKGGHVRNADDFRRVSGVATLFEPRAPHIVIETQSGTESSVTAYITKRDTILEINTADTLSLQMIRGIGRYTARQIIRYREDLGGFYRIEQLKEVPHTNISDSIMVHLTADASLIKPLDINYHSVERMSRHPYLRAEKAQAIRDYRHRRGNIRDWKTLRSLKRNGKIVFSEEDIERLKPYLQLAE